MLNTQAAEEQYQQQIDHLRSQVKSLQYQVNDLKAYILNLKTIHTKQIQALKSSTNISQSPRNIDFLKSCLQSTLGLFQKFVVDCITSISNRFVNVCTKVKRLQDNMTAVGKYFVQWKRDTNIWVNAIENSVVQKGALVERQKKLIEQIITDKHECDMIYQKQISLMESSHKQKKSLIDRLVNVQPFDCKQYKRSKGGIVRNSVTCISSKLNDDCRPTGHSGSKGKKQSLVQHTQNQNHTAQTDENGQITDRQNPQMKRSRMRRALSNVVSPPLNFQTKMLSKNLKCNSRLDRKKILKKVKEIVQG